MPHDGELVLFRELIKVSPERASILEEACRKYPHLWEWHKNNRTRFCEWGYESLSDLLLFLKTHAPKDLNEESLAKFECLCIELEKFQFDNGWISSVRKRVMESVVDEETVRRHEKLVMQEAALLRELDGVRAELNIVEEKKSGRDIPFDI